MELDSSYNWLLQWTITVIFIPKSEKNATKKNDMLESGIMLNFWQEC